MTPRSRARIALAAALLSVIGCESAAPDGPPDSGGRFVLPACDEPVSAHRPLATRCTQLVDAEGRVVVLHGINARVQGLFDVTFDDGRTPLQDIPELTLEDTRRMRQMGFDLLRLPVSWSGIEPLDRAPPEYSEAYLDTLASVIDLCEQAGLHVLIDFHQDAYSKEIGEDGAPLWAIVPEPTMLLEGPLLDLAARRTSAQVLAAFGTFFGDAEPGPTLRTRFAQMTAAVAARFAGNRTVIGYEVFNEPVSTDAQAFRLAAEVAEAIRAVDAEHLIAFEPDSVNRLLLDRSSRSPAPFSVPGGVYAPHVYTLAFIGSDAARESFTRESLRPANLSAYEEAVAWRTPLLIGEFGYDPSGIRAAEYIQMQLDLHDEFGASDAFWVWKESSQGSWGLHDWDAETATWIERPELRRLLSRPSPRAIAGQPYFYRYDPSSRVLDVAFRGDRDVDAPSILYVPAADDYVADFVVTCDGAEVVVTRDPATGLVEVPCQGSGDRRIQLAPRAL